MQLLLVLVVTAGGVLAEYHENIFWKTSLALKSDPHAKWQAQYHKQWAGQPREFFEGLAGTLLGKPVDPALVKTSEPWMADDLPRSFDSRQKWNLCHSISHIRDQANCGSCWAVSAAEVASDRTCIATGQQMFLSDENLLSCCERCVSGSGCDGGYPIDAMYYWLIDGIPTGGDYGSHQGCEPYLIQPCTTEHRCSGMAKTPACSRTCESGYVLTYSQDLHFADHYYYVNKTESELMVEIYNNGPIQCAFTVYEDFYNYKSGVYKHVTGGALGGHAIRILGWGVENCEKYWLVANSWGTSWGMDGYFKIRRGTNECGMESECVSGIASRATHQPVTAAPTECAGEDTD